MRFNFANSAALLLAGAFIYLSITKFTDNPEIFLNAKGLVIIFGGLAVATLASFPFSTILETGRLLKTAVAEPVRYPTDEARQIVRLAAIGQRSFARLEGELEQISNPFLKSGTELILEGVKPEVFVSIMSKRVTEYQNRAAHGTNVIMTMSKYSPALGLAATVLGLAQLLDKLGNVELTVLGGAMAIALSATYYGIILANLVFTPLAELIQTRSEHETKFREMIIEGLVSVLERREPLVVGELVNSYLPDQERIAFTEEIENLGQDRRTNATSAGAAA